MFARRQDEVIPRTKAMTATQTVLLTIFFNSIRLISLNALPPGAQFTP
jgi:hypothetical protein